MNPQEFLDRLSFNLGESLKNTIQPYSYQHFFKENWHQLKFSFVLDETTLSECEHKILDHLVFNHSRKPLRKPIIFKVFENIESDYFYSHSTNGVFLRMYRNKRFFRTETFIDWITN